MEEMKMKQHSLKIGKTTFKNPIWVASGTFGDGSEFMDFIDLSTVGAIIPKTITLGPREGNKAPRIIETAAGLINSIGLENKGINHFIREDLDKIKQYGTKVIVSIAGNTVKEITETARRLDKCGKVENIEINLSCPNVEHRGGAKQLFSQDASLTEKIVKQIRKETDMTLIVKITPNVTDITEIAKAAETGGADAVSLVNTYKAMAIDANMQKPVLGNISGGLSGPAIKPMALKAVWDVYERVTIPIIGIGGIMTGEDVIEFILAGAKAVQIGTANFVDPGCYSKITDDFNSYLARKRIKKYSELIGKAHKILDTSGS